MHSKQRMRTMAALPAYMRRVEKLVYVKFHTQRRGAVMTTLVLLPGMDGTGQLFAPLIEQWPADSGIALEVLRYPADACLGYAALVDWVLAALPTEGDYVLLGESFSGPVAVMVAARRPQGLRALVLVCSFVKPPLRMASLLRPLTRWLPTPWLLLPVLAYLLMGAHGSERLRNAVAQSLAEVPLAVLRHRAAAALAVDASPALQSLACPTLYLQALHDRVVPARAFAEVQKACPRVVHIPLAGPHFLLQTQAAAAATAIRAFLGSL